MNIGSTSIASHNMVTQDLSSGESGGILPHAGRPPLRPEAHADASESAPALLIPPSSTTPGSPARPVSPPAEQKRSETKYAKTLRLTSEQLVWLLSHAGDCIVDLAMQKSLDLKSGANTITFSLSATGVAACTARIFVWGYTDQIVVSDIDGTITK